jgi:transposase
MPARSFPTQSYRNSVSSEVCNRTGERIKTNRRDAVTLARLHRAGKLTGVWTPDAAHEAVRDLVRAREAAADDLRRKRQQLLSFLLRHRDLQRRRPLDAGASALACQPEVRTCRAADRLSGRDRRDRRCGSTPASPRETTRSHRAGVVDGAGRGSLPGDAWRLVSRRCDFCPEIGDVRRFDTPRQLMSFLSLVPAESSTGDTVRQKGLTLGATGAHGGRWSRRPGHTAIPRESASP